MNSVLLSHIGSGGVAADVWHLFPLSSKTFQWTDNGRNNTNEGSPLTSKIQKPTANGTFNKTNTTVDSPALITMLSVFCLPTSRFLGSLPIGWLGNTLKRFDDNPITFQLGVH